MSSETLELMERMDKVELKNQLALQCAPLLAGIKPSNLLTLRGHSTAEVEEVFCGTDIRVQVLCVTRRQIVLLLYRETELLAYLGQAKVAEAMAAFGYPVRNLERIFERLAVRYQRYMSDRKTFPHELGLLLGYPVADVLGFVENDGQNYLYSGYWKVYENVQAAKDTFERYTQAKERMIHMVSAGTEIRAILAG